MVLQSRVLAVCCPPQAAHDADESGITSSGRWGPPAWHAHVWRLRSAWPWWFFLKDSNALFCEAGCCFALLMFSIFSLACSACSLMLNVLACLQHSQWGVDSTKCTGHFLWHASYIMLWVTAPTPQWPESRLSPFAVAGLVTHRFAAWYKSPQ